MPIHTDIPKRRVLPEQDLYQNARTASVLIFLIAFSARILFFLAFRANNRMWTPEEIGINGWLDIAKNWAAGHGYSQESLLTYFPVGHWVPTAARSPVPIIALTVILRIFKARFFYPLLIYSWMLSAAAASALYFLALRFLRSLKMALVTSLVYCFYLPEMNISTTYAAASESLFTLLLVLYFLVFVKSLESSKIRDAAFAGGLLALACLSRPAVLFFPAFYVLENLKQLKRHGGSSDCRPFWRIAVYTAVFAAGMAPWVLRNQIVFHKPIVTTTLSGYNLLRHNAMIEENRFEIEASAGKFNPVASRRVSEAGYDIQRMDEAQLDAFFSAKGAEIIRRYPWRYLKLCAMRTVWIWYKISEAQPRYLYPNLAVYVFLFPGLLLVFLRRHPLSLLAGHFLYFVAFHAAINAQFRFICPLMPYGIMIAVYTARSTAHGIQRKFKTA